MIGFSVLSDAQPDAADRRHWQAILRDRAARRTFYAPRLRDQWSQLTQAAEQLLASRRARDPASIAKRRMTPDTARQRERVMAAIVAIWRDVERLAEVIEPIDWPRIYGASWSEILIDLRAVAKAAASGTDQDMAACAVALAWHFEPVIPGSMPHIWIAAAYVRHTADRDRAAA